MRNIDCFISEEWEERQLAEVPSVHSRLLSFQRYDNDDISSGVWEVLAGGGSICPFQRVGHSSDSHSPKIEVERHKNQDSAIRSLDTASEDEKTFSEGHVSNP